MKDEEDNILCRLTCDSLLRGLIASSYELGWDLVFKLGRSVGMVMLVLVGFTLEDSIIMLLGSALVISLGTFE